MKLWRKSHCGKHQAAFTMVEIAIAIAVIGFALVAIIGVLPTGLQVQRENREDTIINHDGPYWLEAIRSGAVGSRDMSYLVPPPTEDPNALLVRDGQPQPGRKMWQILAVLTDTNNVINGSTFPRARIHAINGTATERDPSPGSLKFDYYLYSNIRPLPQNTNVYDIAVTLRWPVLENGDYGNGKKVFRTLMAGHLVETNIPPDTKVFYLFKPNSFGDASQ